MFYAQSAEKDDTILIHCLGHSAEQITLLRLRTEHNRLNLFNQLQTGQSEMCPCNIAPITMQ